MKDLPRSRTYALMGYGFSHNSICIYDIMEIFSLTLNWVSVSLFFMLGLEILYFTYPYNCVLGLLTISSMGLQIHWCQIRFGSQKRARDTYWAGLDWIRNLNGFIWIGLGVITCWVGHDRHITWSTDKPSSYFSTWLLGKFFSIFYRKKP